MLTFITIKVHNSYTAFIFLGSMSIKWAVINISISYELVSMCFYFFHFHFQMTIEFVKFKLFYFEMKVKVFLVLSFDFTKTSENKDNVFQQYSSIFPSYVTKYFKGRNFRGRNFREFAIFPQNRESKIPRKMLNVFIRES